MEEDPNDIETPGTVDVGGGRYGRWDDWLRGRWKRVNRVEFPVGGRSFRQSRRRRPWWTLFH